ncbi:MAG: hypothetical protein E7312_02575 [Clostridiales bacterium]|nr:hypothetical protein [Clostridiales bacterium]
MENLYPFGAWVYPPKEELGLGAVDDWADMGLTVTMTSPFGSSDSELDEMVKYLDKAAERGIKLIVNANDLTYWAMNGHGAEKYTEDFNRIYARVKGHPALYGFFIGDEPSTAKSLESTINGMKIQKQIAPELNPLINFQGALCDYEKEKLGGRTFVEWLKYFKEETGVDYYCWDEYSQMTNDGGVTIYFNTLKAHADACKEAGLKHWATLLSTAHWCFRAPNEYEYMWQITTAAACGVNGIYWFRLYDRKIAPECYGSPIDEYGYKTERYYALLRCQRRFQAQYGQILTTLKWKNSYFVGFPYNSFDQFGEGTHDCVTAVDCFERALISFFEDENGVEYCTVVNLEKKQLADVHLTLDCNKASYTKIERNGKSATPFAGYTDIWAGEGLLLYPGQMAMFRIDRK